MNLLLYLHLIYNLISYQTLNTFFLFFSTGKNIVPGQNGEKSISSNLDVSKLVPSDETMGLKPKPKVLDFVAESAKLLNNNQNGEETKGGKYIILIF